MRIFRVEPEALRFGLDLFLGCQIRPVNLADVDDLEKRYEPMIMQIAELFPEEWSGSVFPLDLKVNREEPDLGGAGGRFYFDEASEPTSIEVIDLIAYDSDGVVIEITFDIVDARISKGRWHRRDGHSVICWPPPSVYPQRLRARRPQV